MVGKSYVSNKELGLNANGVRQQHRAKFMEPIDKKEGVYWAHNGGRLTAKKGQIGWRVTCNHAGEYGGFDVSFGSCDHRSILPSSGRIDFTVVTEGVIHVDPQGMLSRDWSPLIVQRVF